VTSIGCSLFTSATHVIQMFLTQSAFVFYAVVS